ncbi:CYFA0S02e11166g1_1 [Cyberlindnera fabianii]|uniref:Magnesium transporter n=1 Tax=Cyberlindnera fabianii TaxID=36022 RepID=A0A061AUL4_CYBFA|nr:CYFA0S02e11166g1_1 [Cyberlindnera fabianii]
MSLSLLTRTRISPRLVRVNVSFVRPVITPYLHLYHNQYRLISSRAPKPPAITPPPQLKSPLDFNANDTFPVDLTKIVKPITPNDAYVSCTVFDIKGNVVAVSKHFPKMKFLQEHGLYPRDLRKIDTSAVDVVPSIVIRDNCILVNLLHIKALVTADKVMIFDTSDPRAASRLGLFVYDLEAKLKAQNHGWIQQYEHRALESILINVMTGLDTELRQHLKSCGLILAELEDQLDRDKLQSLLVKSKALSAFYQKALLIRNVLDEVLDHDEDLLGMYLTDKLEKKNTKEERTDFGEVEMLFEAYYKQCDEFVQQSESLISDIKSTEEIVNIILDANRNALMLFELKVTIYTLGFTVATLLPAFYGMNLKNFIEESNFGFGGVMVISVMMALFITAANFKTLRGVQKLTLMNPGQRSRHARARKDAMSNKWFFQRWRNIARKKKLADHGQREVVWKWLIDEKKK